MEDPTVVVATHSRFMKEVYVLVSSGEAGRTIPREVPYNHNTCIDQYRFTYVGEVEGGEGQLEEVTCDIRSCAKHLEKEEYNKG